MYNLTLKQPVYNLCFINFQTYCTVIFACCTSKVVPLLFPDFVLCVGFYIFIIGFLTHTIKLYQDSYTGN